MHTTISRCCLALAAAFGFAASAARADLITPDSIPFSNRPSAVGSTNGTAVYPGNLVTTQYKALGLNFSAAAAITNLNGVSVWAPTEALAHPGSFLADGPPVNYPSSRISYFGTWSGVSFVRPGTLTAAVATSLSVEIIGRQNLGIWVTYAHTNHPGGIPTYIGATPEPNGGVLYTFPAGPGITSFSIFAPIAVDAPMTFSPAWGVAEVSFTLNNTPEPSALVLAGLGALGLAVKFSLRRSRAAIA